jgi:uncharacterized membrane protein YidH (DUF202 family)
MIMASWLNIALSVSHIIWIRIAVGIFALSFGVYNLVKYLFKKKSEPIGCTVTDEPKQKKIRDKIRSIVLERSLPLALLGIVVLGISVNLIELACSAGLPLLYTQILAYNELPMALNYGYILIYVFFFMLDDLVIFIIAILTIRLTGISKKYFSLSQVIGAIIMIAIGVLLVFFPEIIMFS